MVETLTMSDISFPPTDSDDGLVTMETLPASFLHLLLQIVTIYLPLVADILCEIFKKMAWELWGC